MRTPDDLLVEIRAVRTKLGESPKALEEARLEAERTDLAADVAFDKAMLTAEGPVADRQAVARIASQAERDVAFIAQAKFDRVRAYIRFLEAALVSLQVELKWLRGEGA